MALHRVALSRLSEDTLNGIQLSAHRLPDNVRIRLDDPQGRGLVDSLVKHVMKGCRVDDDTLAYDRMSRAIPTDGVFLSEDCTVRHARTGAVSTGSLGPGSFTGEHDRGDILARASARGEAIPRTHKIEPPSEHPIG